MRKLLALSLLSFALGCGSTNPVTPPTPPPPTQDYTVTIAFTYNFSNYLVCSATVTSGCVSGFTWGYLNGTAPVPIATLAEPIAACSSTVTENCQSGTTQPVTINVQGSSALPIGSPTLYVTANGLNTSGAAATATADTGTTGNAASPSTSIATPVITSATAQ